MLNFTLSAWINKEMEFNIPIHFLRKLDSNMNLNILKNKLANSLKKIFL